MAENPKRTKTPDRASSTPAVDRRRFLTAASAIAAASTVTIVPRSVLGGDGFVAPSDRVNVALIGCGGRARQNMKGVMAHPDARVVAVADPADRWDMRDLRIYRTLAGRSVLKGEIEEHYAAESPDFRVAAYEDFRLMLEKEPGIDAVIVSTPDHQHAHNAVHAMRAGKHTYCEKPLTHNIREARLVAKVADETGVATQMGNQGHSRDTMAETIEWVRSGAIGTVREVHAWVPASRWNPGLLHPPSEAEPMPKGLNWDLWLGPRAERPFHSAYAPVHWRDFWDFGCGALGDFACHDLDSATWALNLVAPDTVEASSAGKSDPALAPHGALCRFDFPARGDQKEVKVTWYDGGLRPEFPAAVEEKREQYRRGVMFVGDHGKIVCKGAGGEPWVLPDGDRNVETPKPTIPRVSDHYRSWLDACKGGSPATSHFGYGARLTEITLLGVLAVRLGQKLEWDHDNMRVTNVPEADAILKGDYRKGWEL